MFALSPVPSAQLFEAAGLLGVSLVPVTAAFFAGRLVSYTIYVGSATVAEEQASDLLRRAIGSPWGIAVQVVLLAVLADLALVDWSKLRRR